MSKSHSTLESAPLIAQHDILPARYLDETQDVLMVQLLGKENYDSLVSLPHFTPDGTEAPSPYQLQEEPDFSPEAIKHSALMLAAETLPRDTLDKNHLGHDIQDNISYQYPPSLQSVHLMARAWDATKDQQLFNLTGEMLDFIHSRRIRDDIAEALHNARTTGESFEKHYRLVVSRTTAEEKVQLTQEGTQLALAPHHDINDLSYNPTLNQDSEAHERLIRPKDLVVIPAELEDYAIKGRKHLAETAIESTAAGVAFDPNEFFEDD